MILVVWISQTVCMAAWYSSICFLIGTFQEYSLTTYAIGATSTIIWVPADKHKQRHKEKITYIYVTIVRDYELQWWYSWQNMGQLFLFY